MTFFWGVGGPSVLVRAWEDLGGKRGEREECVYSRSLKLRNTCAVAEGLENPLPPGEIFFTCPWCLFEQNSLCLCSRSPPLSQNGFPLWSTCCHVENLCISEASIHFRRPAPSWSMRKRVTYRAILIYELMSVLIISWINLGLYSIGGPDCQLGLTSTSISWLSITIYFFLSPFFHLLLIMRSAQWVLLQDRIFRG